LRLTNQPYKNIFHIDMRDPLKQGTSIAGIRRIVPDQGVEGDNAAKIILVVFCWLGMLMLMAVDAVERPGSTVKLKSRVSAERLMKSC
jgi:hypothetical protein